MWECSVCSLWKVALAHAQIISGGVSPIRLVETVPGYSKQIRWPQAHTRRRQGPSPPTPATTAAAATAERRGTGAKSVSSVPNTSA